MTLFQSSNSSSYSVHLLNIFATWKFKLQTWLSLFTYSQFSTSPHQQVLKTGMIWLVPLR